MILDLRHPNVVLVVLTLLSHSIKFFQLRPELLKKPAFHRLSIDRFGKPLSLNLSLQSRPCQRKVP